MTDRSGFTLVEAMVTVAVIGLIAGIGGTYLLTQLPTYRVNGATRLLVTDLRLARSLAVEYGDDMFLAFDVALSRYQVVRDSNHNNLCEPGAGDAILKTVTVTDAHPGVEFYPHGGAAGGEVTFAGDTARFTSRGTSNGGAIYLRPSRDAGVRTDRQRQITVTSSTGRVTARRWGGAGWV